MKGAREECRSPFWAKETGAEETEARGVERPQPRE